VARDAARSGLPHRTAAADPRRGDEALALGATRRASQLVSIGGSRVRMGRSPCDGVAGTVRFPGPRTVRSGRSVAIPRLATMTSRAVRRILEW
jgi:hypothetical protein